MIYYHCQRFRACSSDCFIHWNTKKKCQERRSNRHSSLSHPAVPTIIQTGKKKRMIFDLCYMAPDRHWLTQVKITRGLSCSRLEFVSSTWNTNFLFTVFCFFKLRPFHCSTLFVPLQKCCEIAWEERHTRGDLFTDDNTCDMTRMRNMQISFRFFHSFSLCQYQYCIKPFVGAVMYNRCDCLL